jgi:hypothetical protein
MHENNQKIPGSLPGLVKLCKNLGGEIWETFLDKGVCVSRGKCV